jgi:SET and MYND domain-containing protein
MFERQAITGAGNGAVATMTLKAGNCVLKAEPLAALPLEIVKSCAFCFARSTHRCSLCRIVRYCSRSCQQLDWPQHGRECKYMVYYRSIKAANRVQTTPTLLLAARLLQMPATMTTLHALGLVTNLSLHAHEAVERYKEMSALVIQVIRMASTASTLPTVDDVTALLAMLNCNAFTVCTFEQVPVGIGLYPSAALFNHSCAPNCMATFTSRQLEIRTIREVSAGEQLTVYILTCTVIYIDILWL